MRVISGTAKGRKLRSVPGLSTRPITDRVKEALFNILGPDVLDAAWLDLFAGTGAVGVEALSRGAAFVRFNDRHPLAVKTIRENLRLTGLSERATISRMDAFTLLAQPPDRAYDYIYIAPPQYRDLWARALFTLDDYPDWLASDGWAIVQIHPREYRPLDLEHLSLFDRRKYGSTWLLFYERSE